MSWWRGHRIRLHEVLIVLSWNAQREWHNGASSKSSAPSTDTALSTARVAIHGRTTVKQLIRKRYRWCHKWMCPRHDADVTLLTSRCWDERATVWSTHHHHYRRQFTNSINLPAVADNMTSWAPISTSYWSTQSLWIGTCYHITTVRCWRHWQWAAKHR